MLTPAYPHLNSKIQVKNSAFNNYRNYLLNNIDSVHISFSANKESEKDFIKRVDSRIEKQNVETTRWYYQAQVMGIQPVDLKDIHKKYDDIVNMNSLKTLTTIFKKNNEYRDESRRLLLHLFREYIESQQADIVRELAKTKSELKISVDWKEDAIPFQSISALIMGTPERSRREVLYTKMMKVYKTKLAPFKKELLNTELGVIKELGYSDPVQFYSDVYGHPLKQIAKEFDNFISQTDEIYKKHGHKYFKEAIGVEVNQGAGYDNYYLAGGKNPIFNELSALMPNDNLKAAMLKTFNVMGLNGLINEFNPKDESDFNKHVSKLSKDPNIYWDWVSRQGKRRRGIALLAKIPSEIYSIMTLDEHATVDTWRTALHELFGHSVHYAHIEPDMPFNKKILGSWAVMEAYAIVFESLLGNPHWLKNIADIKDEKLIKKIKKFKALHSLRSARLYRGKLNVDIATYDLAKNRGMKLDDDSIDEMDSIYNSIIEKSLGYCKGQPGQGLMSKDNNVYSVNYVFAQPLGHHLLKYLEDNYGGDGWYENKEAIRFMKSLWKKGSPEPEVIADTIGLPHDKMIDPSALIDYLKKNLD